MKHFSAVVLVFLLSSYSLFAQETDSTKYKVGVDLGPLENSGVGFILEKKLNAHFTLSAGTGFNFGYQSFGAQKLILGAYRFTKRQGANLKVGFRVVFLARKKITLSSGVYFVASCYNEEAVFYPNLDNKFTSKYKAEGAVIGFGIPVVLDWKLSKKFDLRAGVFLGWHNRDVEIMTYGTYYQSGFNPLILGLLYNFY